MGKSTPNPYVSPPLLLLSQPPAHPLKTSAVRNALSHPLNHSLVGLEVIGNDVVESKARPGQGRDHVRALDSVFLLEPSSHLLRLPQIEGAVDEPPLPISNSHDPTQRAGILTETIYPRLQPINSDPSAHFRHLRLLSSFFHLEEAHLGDSSSILSLLLSQRHFVLYNLC
jgi:hypothetical protein